MGLFGVLCPLALCALVRSGSEQGFIDLFHFHCQFPPHTDTAEYFCLQAMFHVIYCPVKGVSHQNVVQPICEFGVDGVDVVVQMLHRS